MNIFRFWKSLVLFSLDLRKKKGKNKQIPLIGFTNFSLETLKDNQINVNPKWPKESSQDNQLHACI